MDEGLRKENLDILDQSPPYRHADYRDNWYVNLISFLHVSRLARAALYPLVAHVIDGVIQC